MNNKEKPLDRFEEKWKDLCKPVEYCGVGTSIIDKVEARELFDFAIREYKREHGQIEQCEECHGTGIVGVTIHTDNGDYDGEKECEDCATKRNIK
jgi:superfamily II helicase